MSIDQLISDLLTPEYPKLAFSYDGIFVEHGGRLSKHVLDYCYRHGLVRQNSSAAWQFSATIAAPDGTPVVKLWWGPQYPRMSPVRIRINPSTGGLSAEQFVAILALAAGSEEALETMRISRVDCKVDIEDTTVTELDRYLLAQHARRRRNIMGMVAINARAGTQLVIYDLGAKLGLGEGKIARIEYRQRFKTDRQKGIERPLLWDWLSDNADRYLDDNIFNRLQLVDPDLLDRRSRAARRLAAGGATAAYLSLDSTERKQFKRKVMKVLPGQAQLADVFAWEAEQWHETLDVTETWMARVEPFLKRP